MAVWGGWPAWVRVFVPISMPALSREPRQGACVVGCGARWRRVASGLEITGGQRRVARRWAGIRAGVGGSVLECR
jgi:hypothetical protein